MSTSPVRSTPIAVNSKVSRRIVKVDRIPRHIVVRIVGSIGKAYRILAEESPKVLGVVAGAVLVDSCLGIKLSRSVLEWIADCASGSGPLPEGVVRVGVGKCSRWVAQRSDRIHAILLIV